MTREQAILQAIKILSENEKNNKIVEKLKEVYSEMPLSNWTRLSIIDGIENYTIKHNNTLPSPIELTKENGLPSTTVILKRFPEHTTISSFFKTYFHEYKKIKKYSPYNNKEYDYFIEVFKRNYERIKKELQLKYVGIKKYDKYREKNTPLFSTTMKHCNCNTYKELLILCGYKISSETKPISVNINVNYEYNETKHNNLINTIQNIISQSERNIF